VSDTTVWVTHSFVGWHHWPGAPAERRYLADPHRHRFGVRAEITVGHDDRDVEFHDLLDVVASACDFLGPRAVGKVGNHLGPMSCEMMARDVLAAIGARWPGRRVAVTVDEDGEAGATVVLPSTT
jgi:hypothetical protein